MTTIESLKRQARKQYLIATELPSHLDCGRHMAEHIRPDIAVARLKFNELMDDLSKLDPTAPEMRL